MKYVITCIVGLLIVGCTTVPTSMDNMKVCKNLCRSGVKQYTDDTVACECMAKGGQ